jgi:hypothetical protein
MQYEIMFGEDSRIWTIEIEAPDDETALFRAGMDFSSVDWNPEQMVVTGIRTV